MTEAKEAAEEALLKAEEAMQQARVAAKWPPRRTTAMSSERRTSLCVESLCQHNLTPATPCAITRTLSVLPAVTRHHKCRLPSVSLLNGSMERLSVNLN
jgi:hypothetical protein